MKNLSSGLPEDYFEARAMIYREMISGNYAGTGDNDICEYLDRISENIAFHRTQKGENTEISPRDIRVSLQMLNQVLLASPSYNDRNAQESFQKICFFIARIITNARKYVNYELGEEDEIRISIRSHEEKAVKIASEKLYELKMPYEWSNDFYSFLRNSISGKEHIFASTFITINKQAVEDIEVFVDQVINDFIALKKEQIAAQRDWLQTKKEIMGEA